MIALVAGLTPAGAATGAATVSATVSARTRSRQLLPIATNQGIARAGNGWILSGTDSPIPNTDVLVRTDAHFHELVRRAPAIPARWRVQGYVHVGDVDVVRGVLYVPFEQPDYSKGTQVTARYDARTLHFLGAVVLRQHENSFVTVDPTTRIAYSMDHFDGAALLRYDVAHHWRRLAPLRLSRTLHETQGADVADGAVWISTSDPTNGIYRVGLRSGHVQPVLRAAPPGEGEGLDATAVRAGNLHTLVIDPSQTKVWVEHLTRAH